MPGQTYKLTALFGASLAAGFALTGLLLLRNPADQPRTPEGTSLDLLLPGEGAICRASQQDTTSLTAGITEAPAFTIAAANALVTSYTGEGPKPTHSTLAQDPSLIKRLKNLGMENVENLHIMKWVDEHGKESRQNGPAIIIFDPAKSRTVLELWIQNGVPHRDGNMPALTEWRDDGRVKSQSWFKNGTLHNEPGAAYRFFDWENDTLQQSWYTHGNPLRADGGANYTSTIISSGVIIREEWARRIGFNRLMHREDGLHIQEHNPLTLHQTRKLYRFHDGDSHSSEISYELLNDAYSGLPLTEEWKKNGTTIALIDHKTGMPHVVTLEEGYSIEGLRKIAREAERSNHHHHHDDTQAPRP